MARLTIAEYKQLLAQANAELEKLRLANSILTADLARLSKPKPKPTTGEVVATWINHIGQQVEKVRTGWNTYSIRIVKEADHA